MKTRVKQIIGYKIQESKVSEFASIKEQMISESYTLDGLNSAVTSKSLDEDNVYIDTMVWESKEIAIESIHEENSPASNHEHYSYIINVIEAFKVLDKDRISNLISYPLERGYPIPSIDSKKELLSRFDEVFDYNLIKLISNSDASKDWSQVGWRGIKGYGIVWC